MSTLIRSAAAAAAAIVAGVAVGVLARILMRLNTVAAAGDAGFSWSGSAGIVTLYVVAMIPGAVAVAVARRGVAVALLTAGSIFLCVPAVGVASEEVGDLGDLGTVRTVAVAVLGGAVFATLVVLPVVTIRFARRFGAVPRPGATPVARVGAP